MERNQASFLDNEFPGEEVTDPSGSAHHGSDAFPFCGQTCKIVGDSGEIAIDRGGVAARLVSSRIFQRSGHFFLLSFQCGDFIMASWRSTRSVPCRRPFS